jgi:hypothetical protein
MAIVALMHSDLEAAVREAIDTVLKETGHAADPLFGDLVLEASQMSPRAAHAAGILEGVALAYGLTVLELLDEIDAEVERARRLQRRR